jgi:hypothetical protein
MRMALREFADAAARNPCAMIVDCADRNSSQSRFEPMAREAMA